MAFRRVVLAIALFLSLDAANVHAQSISAGAPDTVGLSPERLARIGKALNQEIEKGNIPGAVVLIARKGKIAYFESFGFLDKATGKRMPKDALFRAYSMTKPWVSVVAMTLVEEGRLQLTDPVSKYLPAFKGLQVSVRKTDPATGAVTYEMVPAAREPTIQDLLRHSSGIGYDFVTSNVPVKEGLVKAGLSALSPDFRDVSAQDQVERLAKVPLAYQPGTAWEYSLATDVLGRVIEAITAERLSRVVEERLLKPLQMRDSGFWVPEDKLGRIAEPLAIDPATGQPNRVFDMSQVPKTDSGGAGGITTASDYLRFAQMMANGGRLDSARILSRSSVALMTSDHLGTKIQPTALAPGELLMGVPGYTFGLGFMVRQGPGIAGVPGSTGEFMWAGALGTFFWVDPKEDLVVVYMSQAGGPTRGAYRRLVKQLAYQAIVD
jgi:CubicO group peptidase (beta-lactamase class C family)